MAEIIGSKNKNRIWFCVLFTLIPLFTALIYCFSYQINITSIYLPNSQWNDELFYYKQVESILHYGNPLGAFGYNESNAQIGNLGSWSPAIFAVWVIFGKIIGWNYWTPVVINLLLLSLAYLLFYIWVKPEKSQCVMVLIFTLLYAPIGRWMLACCPEIIITSLLVICFGIYIEAVRKSAIGWGKLIVVLAISILLSVMRPYFILLLVPVTYFLISKIGRVKGIMLSIVCFVITVVVYFVLNTKYCAPYLFPLLRTDWITLIFQMPYRGIKNIFFIFFSSLRQMLNMSAEGVTQGMLPGAWCASVLALMIYYLARLKEECHNKKEKVIYLYLVVCFAVMILAVMFLYFMLQGTRHFMMWIAVALLVMATTEKRRQILACTAAVLCWIFVALSSDAYYYAPPIYSQEKEAGLESCRTQMEEGKLLDATNDKWTNTVILDENAPWQFLYALPEGTGINYCESSYIRDNFHELKSGYIAVRAGSDIEELCIQSGKNKIVSYDSLCIYQLSE